MRSFSLVTSFWIIVVCLGGIAINQVMGSGPDAFPPLPVYNFSMSDCSRFRNETVLRDQFIVWPEDTGLIHFKYCCEYQPNGASSTFELSKFSYSLNSGALQPAPYFDVGLVDKEKWPKLWKPHWRLWRLASDRRRPRIYCEVSDLRRLYLSRFWRKAMRKAFLSWLIPYCSIVVWASALLWLGIMHKIGPYKKWGSIEPEREALVDILWRDIACTSLKALGRGVMDLFLALFAPFLVIFTGYCNLNPTDVLNFFEPECLKTRREETSEVKLSDEQKLMMKRIRVLIRPQVLLSSDRQLEEGFADASHILLVAMVASSLMEGTARSDLLSWRAAVMYNGAVAYAYLALFAVISACIRHSLFLELQHESDWRWQKVFAQLVALLMMGTYLVLEEDVTEHSLDSFAGPVIGTCVAASVWSAGVEMVVIARYFWQRFFRNFVCIICGGILASSREVPQDPHANGRA